MSWLRFGLYFVIVTVALSIAVYWSLKYWTWVSSPITRYGYGDFYFYSLTEHVRTAALLLIGFASTAILKNHEKSGTLPRVSYTALGRVLNLCAAMMGLYGMWTFAEGLTYLSSIESVGLDQWSMQLTYFTSNHSNYFLIALLCLVWSRVLAESKVQPSDHKP